MDFHNNSVETKLAASEGVNWIIPITSEVSFDDSIDILLYRGDYFKPSRLSENIYPYLYAISPGGEMQNLEMNVKASDYCSYHLNNAEKGLYHFVGHKTGCYSRDTEGNYLEGYLLDNPDAVSATRYFQFMHATFQVGKEQIAEEHTEMPLLPLQIAPEHWSNYKVGDSFSFTLFFKDKPLPLWDVDLLFIYENGELMMENLMTDGEGRSDFLISAPGKYLIVIRYNSFERDESLYYDTSYTYTYSFSARNSKFES